MAFREEKKYSAEFDQAVKELRNKIDSAQTKNNINLEFVSVDEIPLSETYGVLNQIVVKYSTGSFDLLPPKVNGYVIKDYLGIKFFRVVAWAAMPYEARIGKSLFKARTL